MDHVKALIIKFIMCTAVLWIVLGAFYGVGFGDILMLSVLLTAVSYIVGDLLLLPRFENWGATLVDLGLTFLGIWFLGPLLFEENIPLGTAAIFSAIVIAVGEYFFHKYMEKEVLDDWDQFVTDEDRDVERAKVQTEFSEELSDTDRKRDE
ncbi:YndM family protein [Virgibacillus siamensis]|uniref:YndM family protein n=1 Tax=Virgibacillus siamensis TaxID=480071 RepID=UPI000984C314|nr:YndM family protein [Virgibacillus siamensis]